MENTPKLSVAEWRATHSKAAKILAALADGEKTRAQLLVIAGGCLQGIQTVLQTLVAKELVVRVRPGVYALPGA